MRKVTALVNPGFRSIHSMTRLALIFLSRIVGNPRFEFADFGLSEPEFPRPAVKVCPGLGRSLLLNRYDGPGRNLWRCAPLRKQLLAVGSEQSQNSHFLKAGCALAAPVPIVPGSVASCALASNMRANVVSFVRSHRDQALNAVAERFAIFVRATGVRKIRGAANANTYLTSPPSSAPSPQRTRVSEHGQLELSGGQPHLSATPRCHSPQHPIRYVQRVSNLHCLPFGYVTELFQSLLHFTKWTFGELGNRLFRSRLLDDSLCLSRVLTHFRATLARADLLVFKTHASFVQC